MKRGKLGRLGEDFAARLLREEGYRILEKNFRCPLGEIDLIAEKDEELSFVEVKTRCSMQFGSPAEAVDRKKRMRIRQTAGYYMQINGRENAAIQFQVVEIVLNRISHAF